LSNAGRTRMSIWNSRGVLGRVSPGRDRLRMLLGLRDRGRRLAASLAASGGLELRRYAERRARTILQILLDATPPDFTARACLAQAAVRNTDDEHRRNF